MRFSYLVWNPNAGLVGWEIFCVASYEQSAIPTCRSPDNRIWQLQAPLLAQAIAPLLGGESAQQLQRAALRIASIGAVNQPCSSTP